LPTDHAVRGQTVDWIRRLPTDARPLHLIDSVPRIANSLAERWNDLAEAAEYMNGLLIDRRGGRHGFAPYIKKELVVLHLLAMAEGSRHDHSRRSP
jgi:hypothetical protein